MTVLKFRIMYEEDESVFRDVEIKPGQTMMELEAVIMSSYNLPATGNGRFYLSNDNWQKGRQVYPSAAPEPRAPKGKAKAQAIPALVSYIDDPHQHFVYEFAGPGEFIFLVELVSVSSPENPLIAYPVMVRAQGPSPFKKEEPGVLYSRKGVAEPVATTDDDDEEESEVLAEEESDLAAGDADADNEDLAELEIEDGGDLMDGDAIKEIGGDEEEGNVAMEDDFSPEEFSGDVGEEAEEDDFR